MLKNRYLTKSRFKLATECPTKLFYTGKSEYANQKNDDDFLLALAEGGLQVGELAKCYFPGGHNIESLDYDEAVEKTNQLLMLNQVTIYEAAITTDKLFIRADILVKDRNKLNLYEVKAKSFEPEEENPFVTKRDKTINSEWKPYLYDVAFQKFVTKRALPQYDVSAYLMLADKSAKCPTDGLNQKFQLVKDNDKRVSVSVSKTLTEADLTPPILCKVNVDAECDKIYADTYRVGDQSLTFEQWVDWLADHYASDTLISTQISTACSSCEFKTPKDDERADSKSGYKECWRKELGWNNEDFECPTVLDVWQAIGRRKGYRNKNQLIQDGIVKMSHLSKVDINPQPHKNQKPGLSQSERQWLQVEKFQNGDNSVWLDQKNLRREMDNWVFPLHFIDFETVKLAIPFNAGRRPYEQIAFQFSHHIIRKDGTVEHYGEYLNRERGAFPNYEFVRNLKAQLENDNGTIFRYGDHENTCLNNIRNQLQEDRREIEGREELCRFIESITQPKSKTEENGPNNRNMVDMLEIVKRYYYDPATEGSNSIKDVLPAILNRSTYLQKQYSKPFYGAQGGILSHNFKNKVWVEIKEGKVVDPYKSLDPMFQDISESDMQNLISSNEELREGGAAMTAYARMQSEVMSEPERKEIQKALLNYCELDTLAMVMIYEGWKDLLQREQQN